MKFDKTKVLRAAEKYLAQGKIPAAIQEYCRIIEHDADDFTALNTLGDLYARVDKKQEAVACFKRAANHYRIQGFTVKAIAMYKKISRLGPGDIEIASALATLYEQQGLLVDARSQYLAIADAHMHAGRTRETLEVLRRIADLDPNNTEIRLRLADGFMREGLDDLAADAFIEAGERLAARSHYERALDAFTKALQLRPDSHPALHGLVIAHAAIGSADEAAAVLEKSVAARPEDVEIRAMLARAYTEAENALEAERVIDELVQQNPASYTLLFDVARLYLRQMNLDEAVRILKRIVEPALAGRQEGAIVELLQDALARNPDHMDAIQMLVRVYAWQRDDDNLRIALEHLVDTAQTAGLEDEELAALRQLVRLAPDEDRYRERLEALGDSPEKIEAAASEQQHHVPQPSTKEVPTFESFMMSDDTLAASPATLASRPTRSDFEWNSVNETAPAPSDSSFSFADLNDVSDTAAAPRSVPTAPPAADFQEISFDSSKEAAFKTESELAATSSASDERIAALIKQELESVDFYLAQGYSDIARDTLDMLERQYGAHPEITARRQQLTGVDSAPLSSTTEAAQSPVQTVETVEEPVEAVSFEQYNIAIEAPVEAGPEAEVEDAFAGFVIDAPPAETEKEEAGIDPGLAAIFNEFREAVEEEEEPRTEEDYETHYNLGLAYKDMDLLDEAIEEFQVAAGLVSQNDGTPRYLQCCNLLGHCFMQKGMPRPASMWFKKGLESKGLTEDEYQALRYELGTAYEQMGDIQRAIDTFMEVYGIDVSYRGVANKLRELQAQQAVK